MRRLLVLLLPLTLACSIAPALGRPTATPVTYTGLGLAALGAYRATSEMSFEGDFEWVYHLETRTDGTVVEHRLHLEGLSAAHNPGDVRIVVEGDVIRMRGPGTDDECWQFPIDFEADLGLLTPDDLIPPAGFEEPLASLGTEPIAGIETLHYALSQGSLDDWRYVEVGLWLDQDTGAALRYDLNAAGPDPLFDAGQGVLTLRFLVSQVDRQTIEPIAGCEVELPFPADATDLVRLPGLIAFASPSSATEVITFYVRAMAEAGWEPLGQPESVPDGVLLSYHRDERTLQINIETTDEGAQVELLLSGG